MVDDVVASAVYEKNGGDIKVKITIGVGFLKIHTHVHHVLDRVAGTLTWSLDASKPSDLLANTGYWIVRPHDASSCTVYYSCNVQLRSWAPGWLDRYIAREGLPRAIGWLKREAEERAASQPASRGIRPSLSSPNLADLAMNEGGLERRHTPTSSMERRLSTASKSARLSHARIASSRAGSMPAATSSALAVPSSTFARDRGSTAKFSADFSLGPLCGLGQAIMRVGSTPAICGPTHRRSHSEGV